MTLSNSDPLARAAIVAIRGGDVAALGRLLVDHPDLATVRIGGTAQSRTLLHVATDWPGHLPRVAETIAVLVAAGAQVDARFHGAHEETPLHWAASSDDVEALDALLDAGADIEASGAVIGGGTPLADARAFRQWAAAARLIERGAHVDLFDAATLGLTDRLRELHSAEPAPTAQDIDLAFWSACHGGRLAAAQYLYARDAELDVVPPWQRSTPLDAALDSGAGDLVAWLRERGARTAAQLPDLVPEPPD